MINDPSDFSIRFLSNRGLRLPPAVAALDELDRLAQLAEAVR